MWLSPEQVRVMPISQKSNTYAQSVYNRLKEMKLRCGIDLADDKINAKIKRGHDQKLPLMLVVGPAEEENESVTVRIRGQKEQLNMPVQAFIEEVGDKIRARDVCVALANRD